MKIYTKTGDKGTTSLIGGTRVPKYHIRVEAYGTIDELISYIGLISTKNIDSDTVTFLHNIQVKLMDLSAILASDGSLKKIPQIELADVVVLEDAIDSIDEYVEPLKYFVLPGGHETPTLCHIARSICRRGERTILYLNSQYSLPEEVLTYMNRLSDYLFALARKLHKDLGVPEVFWIP